MNKRSSVRTVGAVADSLRRHYGLPQHAVAEGLREAWTEAVGPAVSELCTEIDLRDGVLRVSTPDPAVADALRWRERNLLRHLSERIDGFGATQLKVRVQPGAGS